VAKLGKKIKWGIVIGVVVLAAAGITYKIVKKEPIIVQVDKVKHQDVVAKVTASGRVRASIQVEISARIPAEILYLGVQEGDYVDKGKLLVELDNTRYVASKDQAGASVLAAQASERQANASFLKAASDYERMKTLYAKKLVSDSEFEQAQTAFNVAKSIHEGAMNQGGQALAALKLSQDDLSKTTIRAPMSGTVTKVNKEVGEIVIGTQLTKDVIMVISDLSSIEVEVEVDENDVVKLDLGDIAEVSVDAIPNQKFGGKVIQIGKSAQIKGLGTQEETTDFLVKVLLEGDTSKLLPGMSATADIIIDTKPNALVVPIPCVTMRLPPGQTKSAVSVNTKSKTADEKLREMLFVKKNDIVKMVQVKTGLMGETVVEIDGPVKEGDDVVCGDYKTLNKVLKDGDLVKVNKEESKQSQEKK